MDGNSGGVGGFKNDPKSEIPGGSGGREKDILRGGGMDIFWNYTICVLHVL